MQNPKQREDFVAYLLGRLAEPERERLEERFFADTALFDELTAAEDELVDDYAAGRLAEPDRTRFEEYYLASPERAEKVAAARQLRTWVAGQKQQPHQPATEPWWERLAASLRMPVWALGAAAAALVVTMGSWLVMRDQEQNRPGAPQIAQELPQQQQPLAPAPPSVPSPQPTPLPVLKPAVTPLFAFTLLPGSLRAAGDTDLQSITLPKVLPSTARMTLRLEQPADLAVYRVAIETVEGRVVWQGAGQAVPGESAVRATVPFAGLAPGDYLVRVSGAATPGAAMESVADYSMRIKR